MKSCSNLDPNFRQIQQQFTDYIRYPNGSVPPIQVPEQRIAIYRELLLNNVNSFLTAGFPVLHQILTAEQWSELTSDFFARHRCESPYFCEIAEEFLTYLQQERNQIPAAIDDYPFLLELAHYEWVEMALSIAQIELPPFTEYIDDFLRQKCSISPLAWPLAYHYPVHQLSPHYLPLITPNDPTYLIVYRDWEDEVGFIQINAMTFQLLQFIEQHSEWELEKCLREMAQQIQPVHSEIILQSGLRIIQQLSEKSIVLLN